MTEISNKEATDHLKAGGELQLHGDFSPIGLTVVDPKIDIKDPTQSVKVEAKKEDVAKMQAKLEGRSAKGKDIKNDKVGPDIEPGKKLDAKDSPQQTLKAAKNTVTSNRRPASQKEMRWQLMMKKRLDEISKKKNMTKQLDAKYLPKPVQERMIKDAAVKGETNTPIGEKDKAETSKKAGWEKNPWDPKNTSQKQMSSWEYYTKKGFVMEGDTEMVFKPR